MSDPVRQFDRRDRGVGQLAGAPSRPALLGAGLLCLALAGCGGGGGGGGGAGATGAGDAGGPDADPLLFDFQGASAPLEPGFVAVTPTDGYNKAQGHGFTVAPEQAIDGGGFSWNVFGRTVTVAQALPPSLFSNATVDCVSSSSGPMVFRVDVAPGNWDVTLWLGDVTTPRHQVRATVNGVVVDADRLDINTNRGSFDKALFGSSVPLTLRVSAPDGFISVTVDSQPNGSSPITWTYWQDEDPNNAPEQKTATLVPAFSAAPLQALVLTPAANPPLIGSNGVLSLGTAPADAGLMAALAAFNVGDMVAARAGFTALTSDALRAARAAGLFWVAGHPATVGDEPELLDEAAALLAAVLVDDPKDWAAGQLALQVRLARDAETQRSLYGYDASGAPAVENLGRSCALVEPFFEGDHPYGRKGQILWLRNRGGLDPRRVTVSWERAQWLAQQLAPQWSTVNPQVRLYATDTWDNDGQPWLTTDWGTLAGAGPDWARALVRNLNVWLDLFEWWAIHRQSTAGDIGGGWTDDVEILPAFGLMAFALEGASDITEEALVRFADGIWNSGIIDTAAGYQAAYADVEHTAEPTGDILHVAALLRFGDPEAIERMLKSARTFDQLFLTPDNGGPRHFKGNHLGATQIALDPVHRLDIPLCGRVTAPFPFLLWYSDNPGVKTPLKSWLDSWISHAQSTVGGKPAGVFPHGVWVPNDTEGPPGGAWWASSQVNGQFFAFPAHHDYLYNLAGAFWLATGDPVYRVPFDGLATVAAAWTAAGKPDSQAAPTAGAEDVWAGGLLASAMAGPALNVALASGLPDWDAYLSAHGGDYAAFRLAPTSVTSFPSLSETADDLSARWPYKTTEGVMTDRLLEQGWQDVIAYYIGAEPISVFKGLPVQAASWSGASRLFAAAVTETTSTSLKATTYLFEDTPRTVTLSCWQLEPGASYQLTVGPANGLGQPATSISQVVPFDYDQLGDGPSFSLPGRIVTALAITRSAPAPAPVGLRPDPAVAARDVSFDTGSGQLSIVVHNVGSVASPAMPLSLVAGSDANGPVLATTTVPALAAPTDLLPRSTVVTLAHDGSSPVTVVLDPAGTVDQITTANDVATVWVDGNAPDPAPPMVLSLQPSVASAGSSVSLIGKHFQAGSLVLLDQDASSALPVTFVDAQQLDVVLPLGLLPGVHLLLVTNPDGAGSNLLPLTVSG